MKKKILVVDDDESILFMMSEFLGAHGYQVQACSSASHALKTMASTQVDLVITDIMMPDMDGFEFLDALRRTVSAEAPSPPVIAISGGLCKYPCDFLKQAEYLGAARSFSKPVPFDAFLETIRELTDPS